MYFLFLDFGSDGGGATGRILEDGRAGTTDRALGDRQADIDGALGDEQAGTDGRGD